MDYATIHNIQNNYNVCNGEKIPILMYADDVVLMTESSEEPQTMLDHVYAWCKKWQMAVNLDKTKIVNFRKKDMWRNTQVFKYGNDYVQYVDSYKYLGIYFDEHLTFVEHNEKISSASSRALGATINKLKTGDCMSYESYNKCVQSCILPI